MCTDIASRISSLQLETDEARLLNVGVKPASTLQQAPWWIKIAKHLTLLNLPDGVNDDQRDKDLARIGILHRPPLPPPESYGIRTPSPEYVPRKRRRRDRVREWQDGYATYADWDDSYAHLAEPPPAWEMDVREEEIGDGGSSMMSLLQVVEDDMKMQLGPPPQLTWPKNQEPFVPMSYPPQTGYGVSSAVITKTNNDATGSDGERWICAQTFLSRHYGRHHHQRCLHYDWILRTVMLH